MSYRNRTGLCGLLIVCTLAIASACGGLDNVKVVITDDAGGNANPSGGNGTSGTGTSGGASGKNGKGGSSGKGGDNSSASGAAGEVGEAGAAGAAGAAGTAEQGGTGGIVGTGGSAGHGANSGTGGQITDPNPGPPSVVSVSPRDQATDGDPTGTISITFSEPLDPASVTSSSVQIKDAAGAILDGTLSYADPAATFKPKGRLNLLATYTVNVSAAVTDVGKTPMTRPFQSAFSVRDGNWGKAETSIANSMLAFDRLGVVALATDGVGRATAVWSQTDGTNLAIYAALFYEGKGWATPVKVNTNVADCEYPSVSMNATGSVIVGWIEHDPTANTYSVQARRDIGGTWDAASTRMDIPGTVTFALNPGDVTVAINANGQAFVAWNSYYYDSTATVDYRGLYARHVDAAGVWDAAMTTFTSWQLADKVGAPALAFDAAGNGFIAYQLTAGSPVTTNLMVFRYVASTGKWGTSSVSSTATDGAYPVALATNPAGQAVLGWVRYTAATPTYELMASYFDRAWSTPVVISNTTTPIGTTPTMASATWTGTSFLVAWSQGGGSSYNVYASEYKTAWGSAVIISDGNHSASPPWLSGDGRGNALAVWTQKSDTTSSLFDSTDVAFSRFAGAADKWADAKRVSSALGGYRYPQVVTLADGTSVAAWESISGIAIKVQKVIDVLKNDFQ